MKGDGEKGIARTETSMALKGLTPLLRAWCKLSLSFCRTHKFEDNPWWWTERASVGLLAAAAWQCKGWTALEEYGSRKRQGRIPEDGISSDGNNGRIDLWLCHGTRSFVIEAKQAWQSIGNRASGDDPKVTLGTEAAWKDIGKIEAYEADTRLAATFVVPYIPVSQLAADDTPTGARMRQGEVREIVESWLSESWSFSHVQADAAAAVFPYKSAKMVSANGKHLMPGVLLLLRQRHKASAHKQAG